MISLIFIAMVAFLFLTLYLVNKFVKKDSTAIAVSNWILIIASYMFVIYADWRFAAVLAFVSVSTWYFGKQQKGTTAGIVIALLALAFFKYTNFFAQSFAKLFGNDYTALGIILPLGISFYTFSAIGYLIDIKRGKISPASFAEVVLYLSFFPKITSGPIAKSADFFAQTGSRRALDSKCFSAGIQIFAFGLFKKIVLADRLSVFVNQVYATPKAFGSLTVFLAVIAYSFQIYFDFSGYSDMAIGSAKVLGFDLPRNFNLPYLSHNVTELWKRWHITLSSWLQEYLYISLGGNRKGTARTYLNLVLTMVLGGLWHGANWTFIIWGLLHGLALAVHKLWMNVTKSPSKQHGALANAVSTVLTFLFTSFCWIFFRAQSFDRALEIISRIFAFKAGVEQPYMWLFVSLAVFIVCCIFAAKKSLSQKPALKKLNQSYISGYYPVLDLTKFWSLVAFFVFCGLILCLAYTGGSPFIYGNF